MHPPVLCLRAFVAGQPLVTRDHAIKLPQQDFEDGEHNEGGEDHGWTSVEIGVCMLCLLWHDQVADSNKESEIGDKDFDVGSFYQAIGVAMGRDELTFAIIPMGITHHVIVSVLLAVFALVILNLETPIPVGVSYSGKFVAANWTFHGVSGVNRSRIPIRNRK
jgi:hypothetical protein